MSNEIGKAFVQQFSDNLIHLAQQKKSRLIDTVMTKTVQGKYSHFDRLGLSTASLRTSRHGDTPLSDTPHSRRRLLLEDYETADLIDRQDEIRMLIDPKSAYAESMASALGRSIDDVIIAAYNGNAASIDAADASSNVAFDTNMIVDEDFGTANSNLTFEKLNEAKRLLKGNDIDPDEQLYCVVSADQLHSLLLETEVTSVDYNTVRTLVNGDIDTFMGFKFIHSERLQGAGTEADPRLVMCYAKSGMGLGIGQDIQVKISERDDKSYATQVYASMSLGAVRIEEEKCARIECVE